MSSRTVRSLIYLALIVTLGVLLAACQSAAPTATQQAPQPAPTCPAAPACPAPEAKADIPNEAAWAASPHNAKDAMAFTDWNETADKSVPATCAKCHSTPGMLDFLGADGSEAGKVDKPAPIGTTVTCTACHNEVAANHSAVKFPSGVEITGLGPSAICMECHQGRYSKVQVDAQIEKFKATDPDAVVAPIKDGDKETKFGFLNIHYFAAAATLYGGQAQGGYQYDGQSYDSKNDHVIGYDNCVACHNSHTLEVKIETCAMCHEGVKTVDDLKAIRMVSSSADYNGNGDVKEGMAAEIAGMQTTLYGAIQTYAKEVVKTGIVYDAAAYPYWFTDADGDGKADTNDKGAVSYSTWTPRLLKAAYNYQVSIKDPGAFAHGNKYIVQLLFDSTADLNEKLTTKVDMSKMARDDSGHFAGNTMAFRDWDAEGEVPASCAKCHSATGLPTFIENSGKVLISRNGTLDVTGIVAQPVANGFQCSTCHNEANFPEIYAVTNVPFPNGTSLTFSTEKDDKGNLKPVNANICIECHQGRQSTVTMNNYLAAFKEADKVDAKITFKNVHYFAAGATLFGTSAKGIYEYDGKQYVDRNAHVAGFDNCIQCHDKHTLQVNTAACTGCHQVEDPKLIRMTQENYDGSTDPKEPMYNVIETFKTRLYAAIQKYATEKSQLGIVYDPASNPYYFVDKDGDGKPDVDDKGAAVRYNAWTPRLLKAAYNYQYSVKDPGAFAHNPKYVLQALYDSIEDLGGDLTGLVRPAVPPAQ